MGVSEYLPVRDVVMNVLNPYIDCVEDWKKAVISELVKERWEAGDLYSLCHPRRSDIDIFYNIPSLGIQRDSFDITETEFAIYLSLPNTTIKLEILQNLHGYTASLDWFYSFRPTHIYEQTSSFRTLSLQKLLNFGVKLPANDDDKKRIHHIGILDKKFDFDWTSNEYKKKDVVDDPRGYRYKYGPNIFTFTCLHNNPYRWNFKLVQGD